MAISMSQIVIFLTLLLNGLILTQGNPQAKIVLYDQKDFKGSHLTLFATYVKDLDAYNWKNRAQSVCVTGTWLFYQNPHYNSAPGKMEYVFGSEIPYCVNFVSLGQNLASVRYTGSAKDYKERSINFYGLTYFQGVPEKFTFTHDIPSLGFHTQSIIVTGSPADSWTVFDKPGYEGNTICLSPSSGGVPYLPNFVVDTTSMNIPHGSIMSVKKGCGTVEEGMRVPLSLEDKVNVNQGKEASHFVFDGVTLIDVTRADETIHSTVDFAALRLLNDPLE